MNIIEKLKSFKVEVTPEMEKAFAGDFLSELEVQKKLGKTEEDRDAWKKRAETAEETLKGFEGKDFDGITKDRDEWKQKFETLEEEQNKAKQAAELEDAINEHVNGLNFKDEYRKRAYIEDLKKEGYQVKDGKLIGASDFQKKYDADAFVDEKQQKLEERKAKFTDKSRSKTDGSELTKDQIMAVTDRAERRKLISENMDLFSKGKSHVH